MGRVGNMAKIIHEQRDRNEVSSPVLPVHARETLFVRAIREK